MGRVMSRNRRTADTGALTPVHGFSDRHECRPVGRRHEAPLAAQRHRCRRTPGRVLITAGFDVVPFEASGAGIAW